MGRRRHTRLMRAAIGVLAATSLTASTSLPASLPVLAAQPTASAPTATPDTDMPSMTPSASPSGPSSELSSPASHSARAEKASLTGRTGGAASCERTLNVVAHEDDDLLFINPAVSNDIAAGRCVVTAFVTAGDAGRARSYWHGRELGSMAAYAAMARVPDVWRTDTFTVAGHSITRARLAHTRIVLFFLRLPDAHRAAERPLETLENLWRGSLPTIYTLDSGDVYTRHSLIATLTGLMDDYQPDVVRTLDYAGKYGDGDHADHHTVGSLTYAAHLDYHRPHQISGYMGYKVAYEPENLSPDARDAKIRYFLAYAPHDSKVCQTYQGCITNFYEPRFTHSIPTATDTGGGRNVATEALARASSSNFAARQAPGKAIDGTVAGAPGAARHEWATRGGGSGSWLLLSWNAPQRLDEVDLYDRPNPLDQVTGGVLQFSDGSTIRVGPLPNGAVPKVIHFSPRTVTALRFTVTRVSQTTRSAGLAEIRAYQAAD